MQVIRFTFVNRISKKQAMNILTVLVVKRMLENATKDKTFLGIVAKIGRVQFLMVYLQFTVNLLPESAIVVYQTSSNSNYVLMYAY